MTRHDIPGPVTLARGVTVYREFPDVLYLAHADLGTGYGWASAGDWTDDLDRAIDAAVDYADWRIWRIDMIGGRPAHIQDVTEDARERRNALLVSQGRDPLEAA